LIPFSRAAVYAARILIVREIVAFAMKITGDNPEKMRQLAAADPDGNWNHRRNGLAHILGMVDIESGRIFDFEIIQKVNPSGRDNYKRISNGTEMAAKKRMVKRWEDDQKVAGVVTDQDSEMANVSHESDANHTKKALDRYSQELLKEER
jgi:hypothetical protein